MAKVRKSNEPKKEALVRLEGRVSAEEKTFLEALGEAEHYGNRNAALRQVVREAMSRRTKGGSSGR